MMELLEKVVMDLRDYGIYALPNQREFLVRVGPGRAYLLHDPRLGVAHPPVYLIDGSGQLLSWGKQTPWRIDDLRDTGRATSRLEITGLKLL